jgi:peroxiredoxin
METIIPSCGRSAGNRPDRGSNKRKEILLMSELRNGDPAPLFSAMDQDGNTVSLADFRGRKVFLFFYPKANTGG